MPPERSRSVPLELLDGPSSGGRTGNGVVSERETSPSPYAIWFDQAGPYQDRACGVNIQFVQLQFCSVRGRPGLHSGRKAIPPDEARPIHSRAPVDGRPGRPRLPLVVARSALAAGGTPCTRGGSRTKPSWGCFASSPRHGPASARPPKPIAASSVSSRSWSSRSRVHVSPPAGMRCRDVAVFRSAAARSVPGRMTHDSASPVSGRTRAHRG
jgi:hypothetical protein